MTSLLLPHHLFNLMMVVTGTAFIIYGIEPLVQQISLAVKALPRRAMGFVIGATGMAIAFAAAAASDYTALLPVLLLITFVVFHNWRQRTRKRHRVHLLVLYIQGLRILVELVRSGCSFTDALLRLAHTEIHGNNNNCVWTAIAAQVEAGAPLEHGLQLLIQGENKDGYPGGLLLARSVPELLKRGAQLAPLLHSILVTVEQQQSLVLRRQTLSAQGRMQARILGSLPVLILPLLMSMEERYAAFYLHTVAGAILLSVAGLLDCAALLWMEKLLGDKS